MTAGLPTDGEGRDYLPDAYRLLEGEAREPVARHSPRVVFIEVTNHCNLLCDTCPRTFIAAERPRTLAWDDFVHIVEQFPDLQRAVLHGIGEPLLNRDLPRMIERLTARGVTVLFNTNATLLDEGWARALIASGLDELRCSMDSANPQTYARIRGAPLLHRVVQNLTAFTRLQRELNAERPRVSIWMTGMRENIGELPDLVRLAARMGVPEIYVQRMVYYLDAGEPHGLMESGQALFDDAAFASQAMVEAEQLARELGVTLRASGATDPRTSLSAAQTTDPHPWQACLRPWTTAYITANGNCLPCCISPFAMTDYASLKMGNVLERPMPEIWNNEKYLAWRAALMSEKPPAACQGCGVHWSL
jgi:radical SAM protein with 4Fe4S-binding SPASM domain